MGGGWGWDHEQQPHTDSSISAPSPCLSAAAEKRPGLLQLDFIERSVILPNSRAEFADPLRDKSFRLRKHIDYVVKSRFALGTFSKQRAWLPRRALRSQDAWTPDTGGKN